ncbi:hypothetical protein GCM10028818_30760 [Spirosoma horti]
MANHVRMSNGTADNALNGTAMADHAMANNAMALRTNVIIAMANHAMANHVQTSRAIRTTARTATNDRLLRGQRQPLFLHRLTGQNEANGRTINGLNSSAKVSQQTLPDQLKTGNVMMPSPIGIARQPTTGVASAIPGS